MLWLMHWGACFAGWNQWRTWAAEMRRQQCMMAGAVRRMLNRKLSMAFEQWQWVTAVLKDQAFKAGGAILRMLNCKLSMACWHRSLLPLAIAVKAVTHMLCCLMHVMATTVKAFTNMLCCLTHVMALCACGGITSWMVCSIEPGGRELGHGHRHAYGHRHRHSTGIGTSMCTGMDDHAMVVIAIVTVILIVL